MDIPQFSQSYDKTASSYELPDKEPMFSKDTAQAIQSGAQAGGISGALTSGGISSMLGKGGMAGGGPYALAGGLILSQIEAAEKAKADAEKQRIRNEMDRRNNMQSTHASMANQKFGI